MNKNNYKGGVCMKIKDGKLFYHLTELSNLDSILKKGLLPRSQLSNADFIDIANPDIIKIRGENNINNFIPLHFFPSTPFDYAVQTTHKDKDFIYICIKRELARYNNLKIIPCHPAHMDNIELCDFDEGMNLINWELIEKRDYRDPNSKNACMAECLSDKIIDVNCFQSIAVKNDEIAQIVKNKIENISTRLFVDIQQSWFN
jgi:hypothetical protein